MDDIEVEDKSGDEDRRIVTVYDIIAKLLPLEGRDYEMHPSINERGGVSFSPVAHTEVGKLWVGYLATMLPRVAAVPPHLRDDFISGKFHLPTRDRNTGHMTVNGEELDKSDEVIGVSSFEPVKYVKIGAQTGNEDKS